MNMFKQGSSARRMLALAIVGLPWFLRDQLASGLEKRSVAAQQVQAALDNETQRQQQERDQREASERLVKIEHLLEKSPVTVEKDPVFDKEIDAEGRELLSSVTNFEARLRRLAIDESFTAPLERAADSAKAAATELVRSYGDSSATPEQDDALLAHFDTAAVHFQHELQELSTRSEVSAKEYSRWADYSRFGAWLMTALGALMLGDWTKLLGGRDDASEADASE